jgi:hypothetical protein
MATATTHVLAGGQEGKESEALLAPLHVKPSSAGAHLIDWRSVAR